MQLQLSVLVECQMQSKREVSFARTAELIDELPVTFRLTHIDPDAAVSMKAFRQAAGDGSGDGLRSAVLGVKSPIQNCPCREQHLLGSLVKCARLIHAHGDVALQRDSSGLRIAGSVVRRFELRPLKASSPMLSEPPRLHAATNDANLPAP